MQSVVLGLKIALLSACAQLAILLIALAVSVVFVS